MLRWAAAKTSPFRQQLRPKLQPASTPKRLLCLRAGKQRQTAAHL
jgi:hypothetical protein